MMMMIVMMIMMIQKGDLFFRRCSGSRATRLTSTTLRSGCTTRYCRGRRFFTSVDVEVGYMLEMTCWCWCCCRRCLSWLQLVKVMLPLLEMTWIGEVDIVVDINVVVCVAYIGNDLNSEPKFSAMLLAAGFLLISDYNWLTRLFSTIIIIIIVTIIIINTFPAPWWWSLSSFCRHNHLLVEQFQQEDDQPHRQ